MKSTQSFLAAITLLALSVCAHAQAATRVTPCSATTADNELCISYAAVTTRTNGTAVTGPITYRVEQQFNAGAFAAVGTGPDLRYYARNLAPGSYVFRVFAIEGTAVSAPSNVLGKTIDQAPPNAPVIVIAATIRADGPPIYRVISTATLAPDEIVFVAPESMRTLFASK